MKRDNRRIYMIFTRDGGWLDEVTFTWGDEFQIWKRSGINMNYLDGNSHPILTDDDHLKIKELLFDDEAQEVIRCNAFKRDVKEFPKFMRRKGFNLKCLNKSQFKRFEAQRTAEKFLEMI